MSKRPSRVIVGNSDVYGRNGRAVTFITDETWQASNPAPTTPITNYAVIALREYRNDSGRGRYLARKYNAARVMANMTSPDAWSLFDEELPAEQLEEIFTDYEGDAAYGDFYRNPYNPVVDSFSYEPGRWRKDLVSGTSEYLHNDHLGTLRQTTNALGSLGVHRVYSAFGERNASPTPADRHGYVGAHGYQTHEDLPFQHVGARYYDPGSGRFLQRDPIGVRGGRNVYGYVANAPTSDIDPSGLFPLRPQPPWWYVASLCVYVVEKVVVPIIDWGVDKWYEYESDEINNPPPPRPPTRIPSPRFPQGIAVG